MKTIVARADVPPFDRAAMDGFAVITSMSRADGYIEVPAQTDIVGREKSSK